MASDKINVLAHADFSVDNGVGPFVSYHGGDFDLRSIEPARAEEMAKDPHHRYIRFSQQRLDRENQAALDTQRQRTPATTDTKGNAPGQTERGATKAK